jgi:regulator of sirC expression with transglutaminase-like and TPR domain
MSAETRPARGLLAEAVQKSERDLELGRAVLFIAQEEYPQLPVERYMMRFDALAEAAKDRLDNETAAPVVLRELIHTLYEREGFRGNTESYHDPRNSLLNDVLDRRLGIPMTLGIVMLEVGWRLDLPLEGVNFPGRFLVRYKGATEHLLVDPFDGGRIRFEDEAQELLDKVYGGMVRMQDQFLRSATKRDMIHRLLVDLKGLYVNVHDDERALSTIERLLLLRSDSSGERRDRGMLLVKLGRASEAMEQLQEYLDYTPQAADAPRVRSLLERLERDGNATELGGDGELGGPRK